MTQSLREIFERSQRQLANHLGPNGMPSVARGLDQIDALSKQLAAGSTAPADSPARAAAIPDMKAHYLLANAGVNAGELAETLDKVDLRHTFEPLESIHEADIQGFLRHEREQIIVNTIEETRRNTLKDYDELFKRACAEREKEKELSSMSLKPGAQTSTKDSQVETNPAFRMSQSQKFAPVSFTSFGDVTSSAKVNAFALVIEKLNESRLERTEYTIFANLERVASQLKSTQIQQVFKIAQFVTNEAALGGKLSERAYEIGYLKSAHDSRDAITLRQKFATGAREYLEESYLAFMEEQIRQFPEAARLGGVPSLLAKIRAYMNVKYMRRGTWEGPKLEHVNGQPIYAIAYYFLRTGHAQKALEYLSSHESQIPEEDRVLVAAFHQYLSKENRRVTSDMRNTLLSEYNARFRNAKSVDPYQMALYKIIGYCDLTRKSVPGVTTSTQDWMWLQLMLIRETHDPEQPSHERYSLKDLQEALLQYGDKYFDPKGHNPLHFVHLLLQSAQFEQAVAFMYNHPQFQVEAVQLAVGLAYYGLLRVPEKADSHHGEIAMTSGGQPGQQATHLINFALLCRLYARDLQVSAPRFALQYLVQICLYGRGEGPVADAYRRACHVAIVDMAVSSGDLDEILGSHQINFRSKSTFGQPGIVERFLPLICIQDKDAYGRVIVEAAAEQCVKDGRWRDAVKLYHLAEDYDTVVALFNRELGAAFQRIAHSSYSMTASAGSSAMVLEPDLREMANRVVNEYYESRPEIQEKISPRNRRTFHVLLECVEFMKEYQKGNLQAALQRMEALSLIPLDGATALTPVDFREFGEDFLPHLSEILVTTMTVIMKLYEKEKSAAYGEEARRRNLETLRRKAVALTRFAGSVKFKLPRDTYAALSRIEAFIR